MLRLHDTMSSRTLEVSPRSAGHVGVYVCGSTVYGPPHVGHGRFALVYDVLWRYLEWLGLEVRFVTNVTDLDDKILERARSEGRGWREVAAEAEAQWWEQMDRLGVRRPGVVPHATDYIPEMVDIVSGLVDAGVAYLTPDGVYLEVARVPSYGMLAHQDLASLRAGARVAVGEQKRSPLDFALWKLAKPGEPTWPSPFGEGRPGWHTECVAMSLSLLGEGFELHGGGQDLRFPHHENERAQAVALGRVFARHWVHNGLVTVGGEKMSKSLGNFTTLAELLEDSDPRAYRLLVLQSGYRSPLEVTASLLEDAGRALARLDALSRRLENRAGLDPGSLRTDSSSSGEEPRAPGPAEDLEAAFTALMDDDLDTPGAVAALFVALRRANSLFGADHGNEGIQLAERVVELFDVLGLVAEEMPDGPPRELLGLARHRDAARAARDFAGADAIRAEIEARGFAVEDAPSGTRLRRRRST